MANQLGTVHPSMLTALSGFYLSTCTIQQATESQNNIGDVTHTWANLSGHVDLRCRIAPASGNEVKQASQIYAEYTHIVALAGAYTTVTEAMRVIVDGVTYDIVAAQFDGNHKTTRLLVRLVR